MNSLTKTAKDRRIALRLSQRQLATLVGCRQASISAMENDKGDHRLLALECIKAMGGVIDVIFVDTQIKEGAIFTDIAKNKCIILGVPISNNHAFSLMSNESDYVSYSYYNTSTKRNHFVYKIMSDFLLMFEYGAKWE